jgi:hypothetical protein
MLPPMGTLAADCWKPRQPQHASTPQLHACSTPPHPYTTLRSHAAALECAGQQRLEFLGYRLSSRIPKACCLCTPIAALNSSRRPVTVLELQWVTREGMNAGYGSCTPIRWWPVGWGDADQGLLGQSKTQHCKGPEAATGILCMCTQGHWAALALVRNQHQPIERKGKGVALPLLIGSHPHRMCPSIPTKFCDMWLFLYRQRATLQHVHDCRTQGGTVVIICLQPRDETDDDDCTTLHAGPMNNPAAHYCASTLPAPHHAPAAPLSSITS